MKNVLILSTSPRKNSNSELLASGDADVYDGALFSLEGDFADYLQLETKYFTAHGGAVPEETLNAIREYGKTL